MTARRDPPPWPLVRLFAVLAEIAQSAAPVAPADPADQTTAPPPFVQEPAQPHGTVASQDDGEQHPHVAA
jgi:hypothetical protein